MRLTLLAIGSRGDVQPFVALGCRLAEQGHRIRIAAAVDYRDLVERRGLEFYPIVGSIQEFVHPGMAASYHGRLGNPVEIIRHFFKVVEPLVARILNDCWEASRDTEGLIVSTLGRYCGDPIAQRLGIPMYVCHFHPNGETQTHSHMLLPTLPLGVPGAKRYHRLSYGLVEWTFWLSFQRSLNRLRQQVGLPTEYAHQTLARHRQSAFPTLHAYSSHIAPPPDDWNGLAETITGYWFLPQQPSEPSAELLRFLKAGEPPVLFTFGSMMFGSSAPIIARWIRNSIQQMGIRALIFRSWNEFEVQAASSLMIDSTPHDWLLPQVSAVIHHGGAGITAAAVRAHTRSVVIPFLGDQYFWGQRLHDLGAAPKPLPITKLTYLGLFTALERVLSTHQYQERVTTLGSLIATEDGIGAAVERIERGG